METFVASIISLLVLMCFMLSEAHVYLYNEQKYLNSRSLYPTPSYADPANRMPIKRKAAESESKINEANNRNISNLYDLQGLVNISVLNEFFLNNSTRRPQIGTDPNRMHFPDEVLDPSNMSRKNCTFGLCENVENYPYDRIQKIISRSLDVKKYFQNLPLDIELGTRFGEDGENLCPTTTHTVFPQTATNVRGVEQILVNVGEYKQGVSFETCVNAGAACRFSEDFPDGYVTACQQKYTIRRLMSLAKESDQPIFDNFQMPSCCLCTIKKLAP